MDEAPQTVGQGKRTKALPNDFVSGTVNGETVYYKLRELKRDYLLGEDSNLTAFLRLKGIDLHETKRNGKVIAAKLPKWTQNWLEDKRTYEEAIATTLQNKLIEKTKEIASSEQITQKIETFAGKLYTFRNNVLTQMNGKIEENKTIVKKTVTDEHGVPKQIQYVSSKLSIQELALTAKVIHDFYVKEQETQEQQGKNDQEYQVTFYTPEKNEEMEAELAQLGYVNETEE